MKYIIFTSVILALITSISDNLNVREIIGTIDLNGSWKMKDFDRGAGNMNRIYLPGNEPKNCLPIRVPGTVRTALLEAGKIPDPYFGFDNEKSLWVEGKEWWFFKKFTVAARMKGKWIDLVLEGTSFQGEVWLNGQLVGKLKGMMNPRSFDVSGILNYGKENSIAIRLEATEDACKNEQTRSLTWDTPRDQLYSIAQCMYGWDWGPHGVPIGIWQPVKLRISNALRMNRPYISSEISSQTLAVLKIAIDIENMSEEPRNGVVHGFILEKDTERKAAEFQQVIKLGPKESKTAGCTVSVQNPRLWWPNGLGEQNLYIIHATISEDAVVSENLKTQFGIRELKLVENERVEEFLKSMKEQSGSVYHLGKVVGSYPWTFQINGKKMFIKGANWIPIDQLLRLDKDRYRRLLALAKEAHFNLLRVWGGGLYENEDFYDLCDQAGILTWQEFLSNRNFSKIDRENFLDGAGSAIVRLRNHPSLTFWCGGNEFDPDDEGSKAVIDALESLLKKLDPQREFHRASPYKGDDHYWGVWHGQEPYTKYRVVRPFRSEAGVNTFPVIENYLKFTPKSLLWPPDATFVEYHGEYNTRFKHLKKIMRYADEFGPCVSIEDLITKSELYQALANAFNMEFCRSGKFRTSGLLIWQYNDIWPCLSWSLVDWYGTPKPSYYFQKRASRPVHVSVDFERYLWKAGKTFVAEIHLLNDTQSPMDGCIYSVKLLDIQGKTLTEKSGSAKAEANRSLKIGRIEYKIPKTMAGKTFFIMAELFGKDGVKISDTWYPISVSRTGNLNDYKNIFTEMNGMPQVGVKTELVVPKIRLNAEGKGNCALRIINPSDNLAFFVRLRLDSESETLRTSYGDNYLSLMPGETKTVDVELESKKPISTPTKVQFVISGWNCPLQILEVPVVHP